MKKMQMKDIRAKISRGNRKNGKGQIDRSFVMIMTVIVIAVVAYVGYRGAAYMVGLQGKQQSQSFWNNLGSEISSYQNYGAYDNYKVLLPNGNSWLCFFNVNSSVTPKAVDTLPTTAQNAQATNYWQAAGPTDPNVLLSSSSKQRIPGITFADGKNYTCYTGDSFTITINGKGNLAELS